MFLYLLLSRYIILAQTHATRKKPTKSSRCQYGQVAWNPWKTWTKYIITQYKNKYGLGLHYRIALSTCKLFGLYGPKAKPVENHHCFKHSIHKTSCLTFMLKSHKLKRLPVCLHILSCLKPTRHNPPVTCCVLPPELLFSLGRLCGSAWPVQFKLRAGWLGAVESGVTERDGVALPATPPCFIRKQNISFPLHYQWL